MTKPRSTHGVFSVAKLFGRCLAIQVGDQTFEVKVMGDRPAAAASREKLIAALVAVGASVETTKGDVDV